MSERDFLPGLPVERIVACYAGAPGNEIESGKFSSPESSAALAANAFGFFLERLADLPPLPHCDDLAWPAPALCLEGILRFPWSGGRHPCLDVVVETADALIGIESKRYEPFRGKAASSFSDAYWRPVWGDGMAGYQRVRDGLRDARIAFSHLDAVQLVKHALGLRSAVHRDGPRLRKKAVLFYLFAEPARWPDGRAVSADAIAAHRAEVARFAAAVSGSEISFRWASYVELLDAWRLSGNEGVRKHADAVEQRFLYCS